MKKTLDKAIKDGEIPKIREILIGMVSRPGGNITSIQDITVAIEKTPGLFEADDKKEYAKTAKELTQSQLETLREDIRTNFSLTKFRLLAEAREIERADPHFFKRREREKKEKEAKAAETAEVSEEVNYGTDTLVIDEEIEIDSKSSKPKVAVANVKDIPESKKATPAGKEPEEKAVEEKTVMDFPEVSPSGQYEEDSREQAYEASCSSGKGAKMFGYVVLILGLISAIVGVSVPIMFLIGLGIGVLMLGSAIVYASLPRKE